MKTPAGSEITPLERRKRLLEGAPGFSTMPPALLDELAANAHEETFPLGAVITAEGERSDRLFIIDEGQAEASKSGTRTAVSLALLERGDMFGEIVLTTPRRRQATVTAVTPVVALSLTAAAFQDALAVSPEARRRLAALSDVLYTAKFLKHEGGWRR